MSNPIDRLLEEKERLEMELSKCENVSGGDIVFDCSICNLKIESHIKAKTQMNIPFFLVTISI